MIIIIELIRFCEYLYIRYLFISRKVEIKEDKRKKEKGMQTVRDAAATFPT